MGIHHIVSMSEGTQRGSMMDHKTSQAIQHSMIFYKSKPYLLANEWARNRG